MKGMRRNLNVNEIASLGSNVKPVIQNENCSILMLNDATGEGVMTIYRVLPGVMICFSDMHMEQCVSEFELKNAESGSYAGNFKMVSVCLALLYYKNRKLFRIHMYITYSSLSHIGGFKAPPDRPVSENTIRRCGRAQYW